MRKGHVSRVPKGFFSKRDHTLLLKLAVHWEREAHTCGQARAYYAACVLCAASIEATILATCDLLPEETRRAARSAKVSLTRGIGRLGLADLLKIAWTAGWLYGDLETPMSHNLQTLTDIVPRLRNLVHPGNHLREFRTTPLSRSAFRVSWYAIDAVRERLAQKLGIELPPP